MASSEEFHREAVQRHSERLAVKTKVKNQSLILTLITDVLKQEDIMAERSHEITRLHTDQIDTKNTIDNLKMELVKVISSGSLHNGEYFLHGGDVYRVTFNQGSILVEHVRVKKI